MYAKFDAYSVVLKGMLQVESNDGTIEVEAGQAVHVLKDEWVRYSVGEAGAELFVVCIPAFSRAGIHKE
jgi:ethanolamine utilization protein EutQ (cupin superfamily)